MAGTLPGPCPGPLPQSLFQVLPGAPPPSRFCPGATPSPRRGLGPLASPAPRVPLLWGLRPSTGAAPPRTAPVATGHCGEEVPGGLRRKPGGGDAGARGALAGARQRPSVALEGVGEEAPPAPTPGVFAASLGDYRELSGGRPAIGLGG